MKRPNYNAAKRARELRQLEKRQAKLARRQFRTADPAPQPDLPQEQIPPSGPMSQEQDHVRLIPQDE